MTHTVDKKRTGAIWLCEEKSWIRIQTNLDHSQNQTDYSLSQR